jgi:hypothetical protein
VSPALTASTTPTVDEKKKEEQEEKAAEVDPEKKKEEEDSFPMSPSLSSPPQKKEAEMLWPENDIFESKDLLNLTSRKFEDTTLPSLPLGQGRPSSATTATDVDDDDSSTVAVRYHSGGSMELNACILLLAHMVYL